MKVSLLKRIVIAGLLFFGTFSAFGQVKNDFDVRYAADIRGELTFIGNNIVNRQNDEFTFTRWVFRNGRWRRETVTVPATSPNDPYDLTGNASEFNDNLNMQYIDVDSDPTTFSSSSATLSIPDPDCSLVRYAGLYWSAVYVNSDRSNIDQIKFQVPNGAYQDITADEELFDGDGDSDFGYYSPYAYYKDVTSIVAGLANPNGDYFVANMRASNGSGISGGISGGWTMVVVYENPNLPGSRYITTFDGYAGIKSGETVDIPVSGFTTLPAPFDVNAKIGVAALEGDNRITGDGLSISAEGQPFSPLGNTLNPTNNFFNSNITIEDVMFTARNPNSVNTLGWDVDLFNVTNNFNNVIPNDATNAILRASSTQDKYDIFFASFDVEIIAPNIVLEKRVNTPGGVDITGQGVNLGQLLDYVLSFQNIGNDDGDSYTIRDVLPVNVSPPDGRSDFIASDFLLPPGVTYTYNAATREIVFTIPNDLVLEGGPVYSIRFSVQVAENCFDFIDACSDLIQNLAYSTYNGVENSAIVTDDPSVTDFDACGFTIPGATNFLLDDLSNCDFSRTVELCGNEAILDAGDGFDSYIWYNDVNGNGQIDAGDMVITDGDPDNDPSTIVVTQTGDYIVDKIIPDPCKGFQEIIAVVPYGSGTIPNPVIEYFNNVNSDADPSNDITGEIVQCSIDQDFLPKLFLCGVADTKQLQVNILDAQTIAWERLDSCQTPDTTGDDCANKALTCTWTTEGTGNNYIVSSEGKYRLSVTYQNGCTSRFYFNVFQNTLDIQYNERDIVCTTPGNITITNLGTSYGYQLRDAATNGILIPFSSNNGPSFDFNPGENGSYIVEVTQLDGSGTPIANACIFETPVIGILDRQATYNVTPTPETCTIPGTINIQVNNADADYEYELRLDDGSNGGQGTLIDDETAQSSNNFTFTGLTAGDYIAIARTDDGCFYSEQVTIANNNDLDLSASISRSIVCGEGIITMNPSGGEAPYSYAIWTYVDNGGTTVTSYPTPQDIPPGQFQTDPDFTIADPGDYVFVVVDDNNCFHFSNVVTIVSIPLPQFDPTTITDVGCFGDSSGSIQFNVTNDNGYTLTYRLFDAGNTNIATNSSGFFPNLAPGDYSVTVSQSRDGASCDFIENHTISEPANPLDATSALIQDYTCLQDAIIEAQNVTGGTAPYSYSIDGVTFIPDTTPNAHRFENLTDGTYTITVRDANNCEFDTNSITIDPLNGPTDLTFVATAPNCPAQTADVTVTVVGGNPNFTYEIIAPVADALNNGNSNLFTTLDPGTYTFRATDTKGCAVEEDFTITPVDRIAVTGQLDSNTSCLGTNDGAITFMVSDFVTSYDYSVTGPSTFSGSTETANTIPLTGLAAGTYTITVTDNDTNCTDMADVTVAAPPAALVISNLDVTDLTCSISGTEPGSVTITAVDGWGGYEYELEDPTGTRTGPQGSNSFTGLTDTSGNYIVTVRDAGGCEVTGTFNLTPTVAPVLGVTANSLCYDSATGLILTANVTSGGVAPFQYRVNGGVYQSGTSFTGLGPGSYTVEVIDGRNCTATASIDVFPSLTASANLIKDLDCSGTPDAEIEISIADGNPNYTYEVFLDGVSFQASTAVPGVPFSYFTTTAGTYTFTITDSESCTVTTNQVVVTDDTPPASVPIITDVRCNGDSNGAVNLNVSGGTPPYAIVFDGSAPSTQQTYSGLAAGPYNYTITDSKGCITTGTATVGEPNTLALNTSITTDYDCNTDATISVISVNGGTAPFEYSIDGVIFDGTTAFTGLTDGTYTITVRDANQCTAISVETIDALNPPTDLSFAQTALTCPTVVGDVTVSVTNGNAPFTYEITAPAGSVVNNGNNAVFTGLAPDTYTFRITDAKGCSITENHTIDPIAQANVVSQLVRNVTCVSDSDGEFTFTVSDFISTYSYVVEDGLGNTVQSANNINTVTPISVATLDADTYVVYITDDTTNCTVSTNAIISEPAAALDFTFTDTPVTCLVNSTITVTATDGWGNYEYQLENTVGPAIVYAYNGNNEFLNVPAGTYTIYVRDGNGCIVTRPITIDPAETPAITLAPSDFCYDNTDQASLVVNITDGVGPYSYSINGGGQTTAVGNPFTIANLTPGTYNIQVTDAFGCVSNTLTETIEPQLTANAVLTQDLLCTGNAVIDVAINDGYTPYATYQVQLDGGGYGATTPIAGNSFTYNGAAADGTYQFLITDARNCTVETNEIIITPTVVPQAAPTVTDVACFGGADGSVFIDIDTNFGVAPYTVSFNGSAFTSTTTYSGLAANTYPYIVRDSRGCEFNDNAIVNEPLQILSNMTARDVTCSNVPGGGNILGGIDVTITQGGFANYTYTLYDSANNIVALGSGDPNPATTASTTHAFNGVDFGDYYVRIVDANGCESDLGSVRVRSNPFLTLTANIPPPDCPTGGTAEITASGGSGDYTFEIYDIGTPPNTEVPTAPDTEVATFTGLNPGQTYIIQAVDNINLCTSFQEVIIPPLSTVSAVVDSTTDITCATADDGTMAFTVDNYDAGVTSIDWEILNALTNTAVIGAGTYTGTVGPGPAGGPQSLTVNQIPPGDYVLLVREASAPSCTATTTFRIIEPTPVALTLVSQTPANCSNDAEVTVRASGGNGPYTYAYVVDGAAAPSSFPEGATFTLDPSVSLDWDVYARDANLCVSPLLDVTIAADPSPEISAIANNQCAGDEGAFSVDVTLDVVGVGPYRISVDGGAPQAATAWNGIGDVVTVSNLSSGAHTFSIIDANGCGETENVTIYAPLTILANISSDENCNPANTGEVTVTAGGGSGTYTYTQTTPAGPSNGTGVFGGLTHSVAYTFEVEDTVTNCTIPVTITLPTPATPTFTLSKTDVSCFGGSDGTITVALNAGNIDTPYLYSLDGGTTTQTTNIFTGLPQGPQNVTVISDKGCSNTVGIVIDEPSQLDIAATASAFDCNDSSSTVTVTINNDGLGNPSGTGPYLYSFDNGVSFGPDNTYQVAFGAANVDVVVEDSNGCTDAVSVPVPARQEVTAVINQLQAIDCNNGQEIIAIVASNGSGNYTYTELPSGNVVADPTNIIITTPGNYVYEIADTTTNCSVTVQHNVAPYDLINAIATVASDASCSDATDGTIEVTITGYTGAFDYEVLDNTGTAIGGTLASDNAISDPYTFTVSSTFGPGTYSVEITETANPLCTTTTNTVTIDAPEPLALQLVDNVNANCNISDAIVTIQASGGTSAYTYGASISGSGVPATFPFDNTVELDPTVSLNWDIYVRDANGCVNSVPLAITIAMDTVPDISLILVDECAEEGSFAITVSLDAVNMGVAPYTMSIDGNAFQSIASYPHTYNGLGSGPHTIEIRDANGCGEIENLTIAPELQLTATVNTQPSCITNDGIIDFTVIGGSGTSTVQLLRTDLSDTGLVPVGNQFTGVAFGDYIVRVTDNTLGTPNCFADAPVSLEEPTPVTLLATDKTDVSCNGASDGSITVNLAPSGVGVNDNPPYVYEITDGISTFTQNTGVFTGLPDGTYDITVTSNRNCIATDQITISEPLLLDAAITNVVELSCDSANATQTASIEVTITAGTGTPDYFYSVNGGSFLPTGGNVFAHQTTLAGNYDIVVRDANGCLFPLPTQQIQPLNSFTAAVSPNTAISCINPEEVTITVTDDGNPHNYSYELLPIGNPNGTQTGTTATTATYELTAVGTYTFRVTDLDTGCYTDTAPYEIAPYDLIDVTATATTPVTCFGDGNGALEINVTGYSGGYSYQIFDSADNPVGGLVNTDTSVNPRPIGGLSGGNYYVRVTEIDPTSTSCSDDSNSITILSPSIPLDAAITIVSPPTCDNNRGEIQIVPSGGYPPYDITMTNTTTGDAYNATDVQAFSFDGLAAGSFDITVTDDSGCLRTYTEVLPAATPIVVNATPLVTTLACFGDTNATVSANVVGGGSGSYEYRLNLYDATGTNITFTTGNQLSPDFNNLGAGIYSITVSDGWNCDEETNTVEVREPALVEALLIRTDPLTCATGVEFELSATGGSGTYEYSTDNITFLPMTSNPIGLPATGVFPAGTYQYYVRDAANGCEAVLSNAITEDPIVPLTLTVDDAAAFINCTGESTAVIYAEADGGLGNYQYELFTDISLAIGTRIAGPVSTGEFRDLPAGTYYVSVTSEDCRTLPEEVIIDQPIPLSYTEDIRNVTCEGEDNGSITVTLSGGAGGYQYAISPNLNQFDTINTFTDLAPGDYTIIAQDQNGCFEHLNYTITEPTALTVSFTSTPEICVDSEDGTITLTIGGGTAPYSTALNSNNDTDFVQDRVDFLDMAAGDYLIFIRDANGCETNTVVNIAAGVNLNAEVVPVYECNGDVPDNYVNITLEDPSVIGDVLYALDDTGATAMQLNPDFRNIAPGDHYIAIAHANGCVQTIDFTIQAFEPLTLTLEQNNINEITAVAEGGLEGYTFYFGDRDNGDDNTFIINRTDTYDVTVIDENGCEAQASIFMEFIDIEVPNFFTPDGDGQNDFWVPRNREAFPEILTIIFDRYGREVYRMGLNDAGWDGLYNQSELPTGDYWYVIKLRGEEDDREFVGHFTLYR
ncbi:T9SS type B sorting domain-containing protein [Maribacter sp. 2304DJ31-5]|uniref:T9SS type B sorting domain-containing protein n=1 Tax=Maribacter sp. 2304DJ31-5 TaxID=3386273 RepID=UPI0039BC3BC4